MINTQASSGASLSQSNLLPTSFADNSQREIICGTCRLRFTDVPSFKLHRSTEFHVYNTKRQMAELEPITEELFEQKKVQL